MMRHATDRDVDRVVEMGRRFITETAYAPHIPVNADKMRELAENLISSNDGLLLVWDDGARGMSGMLGALVFEHPMSGEKVCSEMFWWVNPESRGTVGMKMLRYMEKWAVDRGAVKMMMIAPNERVGRFYERVGYERIETSYQRSL